MLCGVTHHTWGPGPRKLLGLCWFWLSNRWWWDRHYPLIWPTWPTDILQETRGNLWPFYSCHSGSLLHHPASPRCSDTWQAYTGRDCVHVSHQMDLNASGLVWCQALLSQFEAQLECWVGTNGVGKITMTKILIWAFNLQDFYLLCCLEKMTKSLISLKAVWTSSGDLSALAWQRCTWDFLWARAKNKCKSFHLKNNGQFGFIWGCSVSTIVT